LLGARWIYFVSMHIHERRGSYRSACEAHRPATHLEDVEAVGLRALGDDDVTLVEQRLPHGFRD